MRFDIISAVPKLLESPFSDSILKRAIQNKLVEVHIHNIRDYATNKHKTIDDYQYGGEAGMVLMVEPIAKVVEKLKGERSYDEVVYMTPDGQTLNQKVVNQMSNLKNVMIICGHYKGVDQRVRDLYVTKEISIGDYVLSGGELAAAVFCDAIIRLVPGVINDISSALTDSFQDNLLAPPVYTRPPEFKGMEVPEVLRGGNAKKIEDWKLKKSLELTEKRRPDLLK